MEFIECYELTEEKDTKWLRLEIDITLLDLQNKHFRS